MGLPVWRAPSPVEAKDAIKVDLNASSRSPIRRRVRSPVIPRRARRSDGAQPPSRGTSQRSPRLSDNDYFPSTALNLRSYNSSARLHQRPRIPPPPVPEPRNYSRGREYDRALVQAAFRDDPLNLLSPDRERPYHVPPPRPSRAFGELPAYTPNFAPAELARQPDRLMDDLFDTNAGRPALSRPRSRVGEREPLFRPRTEIIVVEDSEDNSDNNAVSGFPPLRRMGRRTIADGPLPSSSLRESWSPATTVDGLGDRERSLSPADGHWETMLSTVAPDPLAPTADSSFTSAAASASFSNSHPSSRSGSNSASSSRTHLTVPSEYGSAERLFAHICDTSEDESPNSPPFSYSPADSDGDTEPEDIEIHEISRLRPRSNASRPADGPPPRNPFRYPRAIRERSRDSSRFVRSYYGFNSRSSGREDNRPSFSSNDDLTATPEDSSSDLEQMRGILERLARRDDIPDDFWTSAGLAPPLAERVERLQQEHLQRERQRRERERL